MINLGIDRLTGRRACLGDLVDIQQIERQAGEIFRTVGMDAIAADEPIGSEDFSHVLDADGGWVAVDAHDRPVGYLLLELLDRAAHIEQVTVHPAMSRRGIGAALLGLADAWAADRHHQALTLTTFRDVAWNGPYYRRLGFRVLEPTEYGPALSRRVADEEAACLARWPRVAMIRPVDRLRRRRGGDLRGDDCRP